MLAFLSAVLESQLVYYTTFFRICQPLFLTFFNFFKKFLKKHFSFLNALILEMYFNPRYGIYPTTAFKTESIPHRQCLE